MCLILVAWRVHADFPCIVAGNRDEYHRRPTAAAHWWADRPQILAGRDLTADGTWLGMTRSGRFAALTNFRSPAPPRLDAPSRGTVVRDVLASSCTVDEELRLLESIGAAHNGFNVLFSDGARLGIFESNRRMGRELPPGIYGLSNHLLDTPWPKVEHAKSRLRTALQDLPDPSGLLRLLRDDRPAPDDLLPSTGLSLAWERLLSSAFIRGEEYGTRSSTLVRIDRHGMVAFDEWSWDPAGRETGKVSVTYALADTGSATPPA